MRSECLGEEFALETRAVQAVMFAHKAGAVATPSIPPMPAPAAAPIAQPTAANGPAQIVIMAPVAQPSAAPPVPPCTPRAIGSTVPTHAASATQALRQNTNRIIP